MTTAPNVHHLGIDVVTRDLPRLQVRLCRLKTTIRAECGGEYREDHNYSQLHVDTTMTEDELDHWLWATKHGAEYVGVFTRSPLPINW